MTDGGEEAAFLGKGAAVRHHRKGVHLQAVVIMESQGLMLNDAFVQFKAAGLKALAATGMTAVEDGHVILFCHLIDGGKEAHKVLLCVYVFFTVGREQYVLSFLQAKAFMNVTRLNLSKVIMQYFCHGAACYVGTFLGQTAVCKIAAGVLAVGHVDITYDIYNTAVSLLWQALILAAVTGFHVEDGDMQALGTYHAEAAVGITQHQNGIRIGLHHQLITLVYDVTHGGTKVITYGIHIYIRVFQLKVLEEHAVQVIVIVLAGMCQQTIKILTALVNYCRQADYLWAGSYYYQQFDFSIVFKLYHISFIWNYIFVLYW